MFIQCSIADIKSPDASGSAFFPQDSKAVIKNESKPIINWQSQQVLKTLQVLTDKREVLQKCVQKIRHFTQVKSYYQLIPRQLLIINDLASAHHASIQRDEQKLQDLKFESLFHQSKEQNGRLKNLVLKLIAKSRVKTTHTIRPSHFIVIIWNLLKFILLVHMCFVFPLMDAFGSTLDSFLLSQRDVFIAEWGFLMADLLLRFNIQIYIHGQLIKSSKEIAIYYLTSGFVVDLCGLIGFTQFLFFDIFYLRYIFFLKIPEMQRFLRFLRREIDSQNKLKNHLKLLRLLLTIVLLTHIIACLWIAIGKIDESENWLLQQQIDQKPWITIYISAFYFAILTMTTVGYGDIVPVNQYETVACIVIVLLSSAIFAYTLNTITTVLKDIEQEKSSYKEESAILQNYMIKKGIDNHQQLIAQKYLKQLWKNGQIDKLNTEMCVISKLSPSIQEQIHLQDRGQMLLKIPFLVNNFSLHFLKQLMNVVKEQYYQPGEIITKDNGLFIIYKGETKLECKLHSEKLIDICNIMQGEYYGVESLFNQEDPNMQLKSQGFSIIYYIDIQDFLKCLQNDDYETFCMIKDKALQMDRSRMFLTCPLCKKKGHSACTEIQFHPNIQGAIVRSNISTLQKRQLYQRRPVKYQIMRNIPLMQETATRFKMTNLTQKHSLSQCSISSEQYDSMLQEDDQNSLSSESQMFDSSRMDERKVQNITQPYQRKEPKRGSGEVIRKTQVIPTLIAVNSFTRTYQKQGSGQSRIIDPGTRITQTKQQSINSQLQGIIDLPIDMIKQYNSYNKQGNCDTVIQKLENSKKRKSKGKLRKLRPLIHNI